jgi:aspartyl-tRNA(Asn)/glutamyl-tRNA(Gln) amidotransferase subunit A
MSGTDEIWRASASGLAALYLARTLTPVDAVSCFMERIERIDPALNAFVAINPQLRLQAEESARRIASGRARSPLEGIPLAVKDNIVVAGMPAAWGSRVLAGKIRGHNELPVQRLIDAGALILGKTNVPEFAVEGYTGNAAFGVTRNPWDTRLTPGGSSGGSVAAVAAGLAPAAIGTDGGGSLRRPASYTGLFGFKPGIGRAARADGLPQVLLDFEVVGPLTRSVADAALIETITRGPDRRDPTSRAPVAAARDRRPRRILYVPRFGNAPCDSPIVDAVARTARRFADRGHEVTEASLPFDVERLAEVWPKIPQSGLAWLSRQWPEMRTLSNPKYVAMADAGEKLTAVELLEILEIVKALRRATSSAFEKVDFVLTPAAAAMPWLAENAFPEEIAGEPVGPRGHAVYTGWVNAAGLPAFAAPAPVDADAMPIGFQLVGDLGSENLLLELARDYERANPWADRWPAIAEDAAGGSRTGAGAKA